MTIENGLARALVAFCLLTPLESCRQRTMNEAGQALSESRDCPEGSPDARRGYCRPAAMPANRTFNTRADYANAGQPGCGSDVVNWAKGSVPRAWVWPIAGNRGNSWNWGGGGTAAGGGHEGWDFLVSDGTEVRAAAAGTVAYVQTGCPSYADRYCGNAWGNHVVVKNGEKVYTRYAHLLDGTLSVRVGDAVGTGQVLGKVGSSGASDAPHLHFEMLWADPGWFEVDHPKNGACVLDPAIVKESYTNGETLRP